MLGALLACCLGLTACQQQSPTAEVAQRAVGQQRSGPLALQLDAVPRLAAGRHQVLARFGWGHGPDQLGRSMETSRPGPMSLAMGPRGTLYILDQVNRRVLRRDAQGGLLAPLALTSAATEEIAVTAHHLFALVYEPGDAPGYRVERYALEEQAAGPELSLALPRTLQLITGLFVSGDPLAADLWVEREHDVTTRVIARGQPAIQRPLRALGRPHPASSTLRLTARRMGPELAKLLQVDQRRQQVEPVLDVHCTSQRLLALQALTADRHGRLYLGLRLQPPGQQAHTVMLVTRGETALVVPLADDGVTDAFRTLEVTPRGDILQLQTTEQEVLLHRFALPSAGGAS